VPTYDHSVTGEDIIRDALLLVGGVAENEPVSGQATTDALRALNNMLKSWQNQGLHMWARQEVVVFGVKSQERYKLGPASTDAHWTDEEGFVYTKINGAASSGASTITVDSVTDMTVGDYVGVELDDGTRQWTTIDAINTSTLVITLNTALTDDVADNLSVFTYTSRPQRPLRLVHARRGQYDGEDIPMYMEPQEEYFDQPNKTTAGTAVFAAYKPTLTSGTLYAWQPVNSVKQVMKFTSERPFADIDATSENPDFPIEWAECITFNLAARLESQYRQLDGQRRNELLIMADNMLEEAKMFDTDPGSWYIQPDRTR